MAQIPKNLPPSLPANVTSGRLQGGPRSVASANATPVEGANAQDGVLFNDALLFQDKDTFDHGRSDNSQGHQLIEHAGSSQTFASIFEEGNASGSGGNIQKDRQKGFANVVARAINTYETNVQVIQGNVDLRGTNLSLTL